VCSGAWQGSSRSDPGILRTIPSASPALPEAANIEGVSTFRNASIDCAESSIGDQSRHLYRGDLLPLFTQLGRLTSRRRLRLCVFNEQQTEEIVWAGR
jgi:hypothetical protein